MSRLKLAVPFVSIGLFVGCHTITEELPTKPSSTTPVPTITVPIPVVVTPIEVPTPSTPAPSNPSAPSQPSAPSDPAPDPGSDSGPSVGQSCAPAPAPGNERCGTEPSDFLDAVETALDQLIAKKPGWFQKQDGAHRLVGTDEKTYDWALIDVLRKNGYCAGLYAEEISVRRSRDYSENFDVLTSSSMVRRGLGAYRSTCHPASTTEE